MLHFRPLVSGKNASENNTCFHHGSIFDRSSNHYSLSTIVLLTLDHRIGCRKNILKHTIDQPLRSIFQVSNQYRLFRLVDIAHQNLYQGHRILDCAVCNPNYANCYLSSYIHHSRCWSNYLSLCVKHHSMKFPG